MKYLKLFEDFFDDDEYDQEREDYEILYNEWFKKYREYVKQSEEEQTKELDKITYTSSQNPLGYNEFFDKTWKEHTNRLEQWKRNNPAPTFERDVIRQQESDRVEKALKELIKILGLNKTGSWGSGNNPFDDDLGNFNIKNKTILAVKPHYIIDEDGSDDEEIMDGVKLELIMVHPDHRNKGSATKRMQEFLHVTDNLKLKVFLTIVPQDDSTNEDRLVEFYKKFGFKLKNEFGTKHMVREPLIGQSSDNPV